MLAIAPAFLAALVGGSEVEIVASLVASGFQTPVQVVAAPLDTQRLFVVEHGSAGTARIRILELAAGTIRPTAFLTISGMSTGGERGLHALAFHPNFATNRTFFVHLSDTATRNSVWSYQASAIDPNVADPSTRRDVLRMDDPFDNHNGGWIGFASDGYLYVATGDGGAGGDPLGNSQNTSSLLGKILRLDIDGDAFPADATRNYAIPPGNPFAGAIPGADEVWHFGLRNPWRSSFDRATGDLYIGDVGEDTREEIDVAPVGSSALNFGWRCREGTTCTGASSCLCPAPAYTDPILEYGHAAGCAVTGGVVYRGSACCGLQGTYFYSDWCAQRVWSVRWTPVGVQDWRDRTLELNQAGNPPVAGIVSFGEDANGELYLVGDSGMIFKIVPRGTVTHDCNGNGAWDECDIQNATSTDVNLDDVPDECQYSVLNSCPGDGSGTVCPCGNSGLLLHGCANSANAAGGRLQASGIPSLGADSLVLAGDSMNPSSALYFQGTSIVGGGAGSVFGDGLRCAGGTVIRLGTLTNVGGASSYPGAGDPPISVRGLVSLPGSIRVYQVRFRDAHPTFCTTATFNLTNAIVVGWMS